MTIFTPSVSMLYHGRKHCEPRSHRGHALLKRGRNISNVYRKIIKALQSHNIVGKIQDLKRNQSQLVQQWGPDVVGE
jgi:hypothetical protein